MAIIYKIVDNTTNNCYIGSTKNTIKTRMASHEGAYRRYVLGNLPYAKAFDILKNDNYSVYEVENIDDDSLRYFRERYHIEHTPQAINKNIPARGKKEYYSANAQKYKDYMKRMYDENINNYKDNKHLKYINGSYRNHCHDRYIEQKNYEYLQALIISELDDVPLKYTPKHNPKYHEMTCWRYIQNQIIRELDN